MNSWISIAISRILNATDLKQRLAAIPEALAEMAVCAKVESIDRGTLAQRGLENKGFEELEDSPSKRSRQ